MRNVIFAINTTLNGCVDHTKSLADDETHEYFTQLLGEVDLLVSITGFVLTLYPRPSSLSLAASVPGSRRPCGVMIDRDNDIPSSTITPCSNKSSARKISSPIPS